MNEISISVIAGFSSSGYVHRAFGHLLAAAPGSLLCVPVALAAGDLRQVVDGCPVPWDEVFAVIEQPPFNPLATPPDGFPCFEPALSRLAALGWPDAWQLDMVAIGPGARANVLRLSHRCGLRFANV